MISTGPMAVWARTGPRSATEACRSPPRRCSGRAAASPATSEPARRTAATSTPRLRSPQPNSAAANGSGRRCAPKTAARTPTWASTSGTAATPQLRLYKRSAGTWIQLGNSYSSGPLAAGTQLKLTAVGSTISFLQNGVDAHSSHRHQPHRRRARHHVLRRRNRRQLDQAERHPSAPIRSAAPFPGSRERWCCKTTVVTISASAATARSRSARSARWRRLQRDRQDQPQRPDLHRLQRLRHRRLGQRHQHRRRLHGNSATAGADDFNRADGGLGANWAAISDGGLSISSQAVVGSSSGLAGDIRTGETYASDQYSQVEVTSTQLSGGQWIGPAVRTQNGGQDTYLGIYFWNSGSPQLRLYKRSAGTWIQLGSSYSSGPLAAGTQLKLTAVGSTISFLQNGVERIAVTDTSLTGGAPGIMSFGAATADNWTGGNRHLRGHLFGRRHRFRAVGHGGVAGQRRQRSQRQRQRPVHVRHAPARWRGLQRDRQDQPHRPDLHRRQRPPAPSPPPTSPTSPSPARQFSDPGSDDFNRADGGLGANWADISDGGLSISSQAAARLRQWPRRRHPHRRDVQQRPVLPGRGHLNPAHRPVDRPAVRTKTAARTPTSASTSGQRQPDCAVQANAGTDPARQLLQQRPCRRHPAQLRRRLHNLFLRTARRSQSPTQPAGGAPPSFLRRQRRQLDRRNRHSPATYSIGGTVSGLSGTVVLQDNGGDDLSVSGNGPFTFAPPGRRRGLQRDRQDQPRPARPAPPPTPPAPSPPPTSPTSPSPARPIRRRSGSDDFNRADGGLGASWAAISATGACRSPPRRWSGQSGGHRRRHPHRRDVCQRPVLPDRVHLDPAHRRPVDRAGGTHPKRRPGHLPRASTSGTAAARS